MKTVRVCGAGAEGIILVKDDLRDGFGAMVREDNEVRNVLELQEDERIFGPILLGYPKGYPERPPKREPQVKWL